MKSNSLLESRFMEYGDQIAFIHHDDEYQYSWALSKLHEYEELLNTLGIVGGDVVMLAADYSPSSFCFLLAVLGRGAVVAPVTSQSVVELSVIRDIAEANWVVTFNDDASRIRADRTAREIQTPLLAEFTSKAQPGLLLFSSGSTGEPKGILLDFDRVLEKFRQRRPPVRAIAFLMLDHFGGINTLLHLLSNGGTVVSVTDRSITEICASIQRYKVELLPTTPSFLNLLVHSKASKDFDLSSLKVISYGTEVMAQPTLDRLSLMFPNIRLQQTYGLSEVGVLRTASRPDGTLWMRMGGNGFETRIVDGILWIRSSYSMVGYLNAPQPFDDDGWFNTQDRVEVDGEYFRVLGRVTDLINVGGQKVYPAEIEDVILTMENITDVRVYGEAHPLLGMTVVAEVSLEHDENASTLRKRVRKACLESLANYKVPSKVEVVHTVLYSHRQKKIRQASRLETSHDD